MSFDLAIKLMKYPTAIGRMVIVIINNIYCIPTYVIWMTMLLPLKRLHPDAYYKIEGLFFHWLLAIVSMWSYTVGYDIVEAGDDISECRNSRTLVIANHQSTADVPLLMANFNAKDNILPNIMWIMDRLFKFTNFGIVSIIHQDFFIASGKNKRIESINALKQHLKSSFLKRKRKWMVLFPEGGFLRKRREVSQRFAQKNNLPILEHVTLPRVGALTAIMNVMCTESDKYLTKNNGISLNSLQNGGDYLQQKNNCNKSTLTSTLTTTSTTISSSSSSSNATNNLYNNKNSSSDCLLEYILDITIAYPNGKPLDLPNILHGMRGSCKTHMLYRLYKVSDIPKDDDEELTQWLYDRFVEKNTLLDNFYKSGNFYNDRNNNYTIIQQDILRFLLINLFFITSTYFHYQIFCTIYTYCFHLTFGGS